MEQPYRNHKNIERAQTSQSLSTRNRLSRSIMLARRLERDEQKVVYPIAKDNINIGELLNSKFNQEQYFSAHPYVWQGENPNSRQSTAINRSNVSDMSPLKRDILGDPMEFVMTQTKLAIRNSKQRDQLNGSSTNLAEFTVPSKQKQKDILGLRKVSINDPSLEITQSTNTSKLAISTKKERSYQPRKTNYQRIQLDDIKLQEFIQNIQQRITRNQSQTGGDKQMKSLLTRSVGIENRQESSALKAYNNYQQGWNNFEQSSKRKLANGSMSSKRQREYLNKESVYKSSDDHMELKESFKRMEDRLVTTRRIVPQQIWYDSLRNSPKSLEQTAKRQFYRPVTNAPDLFARASSKLLRYFQASLNFFKEINVQILAT